MLCLQSLSSLASTLGVLSENPGEDFEVVSVSIDPRETPAMALEKKAHYVERSGKPSIAERLALPDGHRGEHPAPHEGGWLPLRLGRADAAVRAPRRHRHRHAAGQGLALSVRHRLRPARSAAGACSMHPRRRSARLLARRCSTAITTTCRPAATAWRSCGSCSVAGAATVFSLGTLIFVWTRRERRQVG